MDTTTYNISYDDWFNSNWEQLNTIYDLLKRHGSSITREEFYPIAFKYSDTTIYYVNQYIV